MNKTSFIEVTNLKCENKINPLGIDEVQPQLSWLLKSSNKNLRGQKQTAYQILVSSSQNNLKNNISDLWDSGKVVSDKSVFIEYSGKKLNSRIECWWKVRVWDENKIPTKWSEASFWKMGLLKESDWKAKWIGYDKWIIEHQKKMKYGFEKNKDKWIWCDSKNKIGKFYFRKSFNIKNINDVISAKLFITADERFILFLNGKEISKSDDKIFSWTRPHLINIKSSLSEGKNVIAIEGINTYLSKPGLTSKLFIEFSNSKQIIIRTNSSWKSHNKFVKGWNKKSFKDIYWKNSNIIASLGDLPWRIPEKDLILPPPSYIRKTFYVSEKIKNAYVYISALGLYNPSINCKQISKDRLTPGWTDYNIRVNYITYDVKKILNENSDNTIGIILADGWYSGYLGWERERGYYGKVPKVICQLEIEYVNGKKEIIKSDESWKASYGPIREADILMGETYDARMEKQIEGWNKKSFNDRRWYKVKSFDKINIKLTSHPGNPVRVNRELKTIKINSHSKGKYIFDFGQNFAGVVRIRINGKKSKKIVLRYGEMLNEDGTLYTENLRMARANDTYFTKGEDEEIWEPLFTYHGFRYVEVSGLNEIPNEETIMGIVIHSEMTRSGNFESSNKLLNKIYKNIIWSQRSNYMDIPTDCPQRDERLGWTADAIDFIKTAVYNFDVYSFYKKWLQDLNDAQELNGAYPAIAPFPKLGVGPLYSGVAGFADAGIITPYFIYKFYNDKKLLEKYYPNMQRYVNYLIKNSKNFIRPDYGYGDWLSIDAETSNEFIGTAFFAHDVKLMSEISKALRKISESKQYELLFKQIRNSFNNKFVLKDGQLKETTQTASLLAINFNLLSKRNTNQAFNNLIQDIEAKDWHFSTGFIGLQFLLTTLSSYNRDDIAYKLLLDRRYPSWGFMIKNGATSMWERWNSYLPDKGIYNPLMNSFNHTSLGVIGEWFYSNIGGIHLKKDGFQEIIIKPKLGGGLKFAKTTYNSINGKIVSNWKINKNKFFHEIEIPINTRAIVYIPAISLDSIFECGILIKQVEKYYIFKK